MENNKNELMNLIYDTLMKNTNNPQFDCDELDHQSIDNDKNKIYFVLNNIEYCLDIKETGNAVC